MPRPTKHSPVQILDAAATIVAREGVAGATIGAIGHAIGAPSGSIYHRFKTRDELLGALWLRTARRFQDAFAEALEGPDALEAGLNAALSIGRVARQDLQAARIMLLYRREDFLSGRWSAELMAEAERLGAQARGETSAFAKRLFGKPSQRQRHALLLAMLDLPYAAVRRYVMQNEAPPGALDDMIAGAYRAIIAEASV